MAYKSEKYRDRMALRFLKERLIKNGILMIDGNHTRCCKHKTLFKKYGEVFGTLHLQDFLKQEEKIKTFTEDDFVYVFANLEHNICKIGYTKSVFKRLQGVQTGCPIPLIVYKVFNGDRKTEKLLHRKYKKYKMSGEWFRLEGDLKLNMENAKSIDCDMVDTKRRINQGAVRNISYPLIN